MNTKIISTKKQDNHGNSGCPFWSRILLVRTMLTSAFWGADQHLAQGLAQTEQLPPGQCGEHQASGDDSPEPVRIHDHEAGSHSQGQREEEHEQATLLALGQSGHDFPASLVLAHTQVLVRAVCHHILSELLHPLPDHPKDIAVDQERQAGEEPEDDPGSEPAMLAQVPA